MFDIFKSKEEKSKDDRPRKGVVKKGVGKNDVDNYAQKSKKSKKENSITDLFLWDELDEDE